MKTDLSAMFADYAQVIGQMPFRFTSHQFILKLAQRNQKEYIEALHDYRDGPEPFRAVHILLAKQLREHPTLVRDEGKATSPDIFGSPSECMTWAKVGK